MAKDNNINEIVNAAIAIIENETLNKSMRLKAREQGAKFSWEIVAQNILKHYSDL